jgi:integrase
MAKAEPAPSGRETMSAIPGAPHLFVRVHPSGVASYLFRYRKNGHAYKAALGLVGTLSEKDARKVAQIYVGEIARDIDPIATRKEAAESRRAEVDAARRAKIEAAQEGVFTVGVMIKTWAAPRKDDTRSVRYVASTEALLTSVFGPVLDLPAHDLSEGRIEQLVTAAERRGPTAAARAQNAIGMAFRRAIKTGKLKANPCATLEQRKHSPRERTLTTAEIKRVWRGAGKMPVPFGAYVRFLMATGVRRNEALHARWDELENDLLHLPADRMKAKRDFTVPLTHAALQSLPTRNAGKYIFSTTDGAHPIGGTGRIKAMLDAAIEADGEGPLAPWTFHHLRHALVTWLSDHGVDYVIADLCLGHGIPLGRSGKTYQRSYKITERRAALDMWSTLLDPEPEPIRKGRRTSLRVIK